MGILSAKCGNRELHIFELKSIHGSDLKYSMEQAKADFADKPGSDSEDEPDDDWQTELVVDKQGKVKDTFGNLALILRNDPHLKDISYNIHRSDIDVRHDQYGNTTLPWRQIKPGWTESDLGFLQIYPERICGLYTPRS